MTFGFLYPLFFCSAQQPLGDTQKHADSVPEHGAKLQA